MKDLFERIPEEKRNRIINSAINEFATFGYRNANTNTIARKAGISIGSLFQYFDNKEDLFLTTVRHCSALMQESLESIMADEEDILLKLEKLLRTILKHSRENANMIRLYNEMATQSNSHIICEAVNDLEAVTAKLYSRLIAQAQSANAIRPDCDPGMFAFLLDNLLMMLQFSYSCDYYKARFQLYGAENILERDDFVIEQTLRFIQTAFSPALPDT